MGLTKDLGALPRAITVSSANNVGIGIAPTSKLHVSGSENSSWVTQIGSALASGHNLYFGYNNNTDTTYGLLISGGRGSANQLDFAVTNKFYINGNGNVLINTTTDSGYKLNVNGSARIQAGLTLGDYDGLNLKFKAATSTGTNYLRFYNSADTPRGYLGLFWNGSSDYMLYDTGSLESQFASSNKFTFIGANMGIGTGVPSSKVHIEGLFGTSGDAIRLQNTTGYTTGNRLNMDFWFKSAAWTNARTAQIAAVTTESYWPNTDISFSTNANTSATALKEVMRVKQDGSVSNNGVLTQYASGSASVLNTFYFDFVAYPSTAYKVIAGITHWNAAYGAYKECVQFNDSYSNISELSITNHTSAAGGSWAISRPNNTTLRVTHNGGNYDGGANFWIQVIGV